MTADERHTILVAIGPGALSFIIAIAGLMLRLPTWRHRRVWFASLTFFLLQAAIIALVIVVFGGGLSANLFTVTGGIGLLVYGGTLAIYWFKASKAEGPPVKRS